MDSDRKFLQRTIELAKESARQGGFPAGAVIVKDGKIIAEGISISSKLYDPSAHAETSAIRQACKNFKTTNLQGATIYASMQSCLMCFAAANWANISKIVYAYRKTPEMISKNYYEGRTQNENINVENNKQLELLFIPDFENEVLKIMREWEKRLNINSK